MRNCVRQLRRIREISQEKLAKEIGVARQTIMYIERGTQDPSTSTALKIAEFFGKELGEVFKSDDVNFIQQVTISKDKQQAQTSRVKG